jgi:ankyrin repeat protein
LAALHRDRKSVAALLRSNANPNARDRRGATPLSLAAGDADLHAALKAAIK